MGTIEVLGQRVDRGDVSMQLVRIADASIAVSKSLKLIQDAREAGVIRFKHPRDQLNDIVADNSAEGLECEYSLNRIGIWVMNLFLPDVMQDEVEIDSYFPRFVPRENTVVSSLEAYVSTDEAAFELERRSSTSREGFRSLVKRYSAHRTIEALHFVDDDPQKRAAVIAAFGMITKERDVANLDPASQLYLDQQTRISVYDQFGPHSADGVIHDALNQVNPNGPRVERFYEILHRRTGIDNFS